MNIGNHCTPHCVDLNNWIFLAKSFWTMFSDIRSDPFAIKKYK